MKISLTRGKEAIIDSDDFGKVSQSKWHFEHGYARGSFNGRRVYLHQLIMQTKKGQVVDHINRNKLDNRKKNLRICSQSENMLNGGMWSHNSSGIRGVSRHSQMKKWRARVKIHGKEVHLGLFPTKKLASEALKLYNSAR